MSFSIQKAQAELKRSSFGRERAFQVRIFGDFEKKKFGSREVRKFRNLEVGKSHCDSRFNLALGGRRYGNVGYGILHNPNSAHTAL
jgi:hypothetical protein